MIRRVAAALSAVTLVLAVAGCDSTIEMPRASSDYIEQDANAVIEELQEAGFENIYVEQGTELWFNNLNHTENTVEAITLDGMSAFEAGEVADADSNVVITYYWCQDYGCSGDYLFHDGWQPAY
ncbi:hypothetical protein BSP109_03283 [Brevibacterium sp. Mu109]|uniref:hypothetical protein n=1 Tax=Brevibacterium sp. Mu109 TaxID=1255669 RepID=UPI000C5282A2|nr:hypothetical protein [Brevibacterium sp. Mu109]SMY01466.1 hypothetical protein BSP109_03283 [Brevibacterium sp. Mu109]